MDIYKTLKIASAIVSGLGLACNIAASAIGEKKQTIEMEMKIEKALKNLTK